jgi:CBS domain-containing protein
MDADSPSSNVATPQAEAEAEAEAEGGGRDTAPVVPPEAEASEAIEREPAPGELAPRPAEEPVASPPDEPAPAEPAGTSPPEEPAPAEPPHAALPDESAPAESPAIAPAIVERAGSIEESDLVELEPDFVRPPLPPSLRPSTAKDSRSEPLGITANLPPPSWPPKVVADLMTRKIITVRQGDPIGELDVCMQRFRFRHLPVVAEGMKLVGLITRTDLLHAKLGTRPDGTAAPPADASTPAESIMRMNVVVARLDSPLSTACRVMLKNQLSCLPVALDDGTLVGILTMTDFLKVVLALF